jgi:hypothetical protein
MTNCPNCGAPVDLTAKSCPYCGTPYPRPRKTAQAVAIGEPCTLHIDGTKLAAAIADGIITPNEARRRLGFREL